VVNRSLIAKALLAALVLAPAAFAQHHEHGGHGGGFNGGPHGGPGWHGDIHHFNGHDRGVWAGGRWFHGPHRGHDGWWWVVGPSWYYYPAPVYPYPDPFWPSDVGQVGPGYWFYCPSVGGYYPYVAVCPGGWATIPAGP
jgi:hypothetical protein